MEWEGIEPWWHGGKRNVVVKVQGGSMGDGQEEGSVWKCIKKLVTLYDNQKVWKWE